MLSPSHAAALVAGLKKLGWDKMRPTDLYGDEVTAWLERERRHTYGGAWLNLGLLSEVERDTEEAYLHRREHVKLLLEKISIDRNDDGRTKVAITYRFDPPLEASAGIVGGIRNSLESLREETR